MYQPGDVVLIPFPFSDLQTTKRRPVLVLGEPDQRNDFPCLAITSRPQKHFAVATTQEDLHEGKIPKASWVRIDKVYTLSTSLVVNRFGRLTPACYSLVHQKFCKHFVCT